MEKRKPELIDNSTINAIFRAGMDKGSSFVTGNYGIRGVLVLFGLGALFYPKEIFSCVFSC